MKIVIRAGGIGTRLWPVSRQKKPKHFLPLLGKRSLLEEKVDELQPLLKGWKDLYISVSKQFVSLVRRLVPRIPDKNIIAEPCSRNTGPAVALETALIEAGSQGKDDPVIASLTVDDVFTESGKFRDTLRSCEHFLKHHPLWIVAIASSVAKPDPGLSYIKLGRKIAQYGSQPFHRSQAWVEKPKAGQLTRLLKNPRVFAHTGLYVWKASTVLSLFEKHAPAIYELLRSIQRAYGTVTYHRVLERQFHAMPLLSIEEAIARKAKNIAVAAGDYSWSDTGKWYLVKDLLSEGRHNVTRGRVLTVDCEDNLIYAPKGKVIGAVGLREMIVVDTGDAVLVCPKNRSGDVKTLVERLKEHKLDKFL